MLKKQCWKHVVFFFSFHIITDRFNTNLFEGAEEPSEAGLSFETVAMTADAEPMTAGAEPMTACAELMTAGAEAGSIIPALSTANGDDQ